MKIEEDIREKIVNDRKILHIGYIENHENLHDFFTYNETHELKETRDSFFIFSNTREKLIEIKKYNINWITFEEEKEDDEDKFKSKIYAKSYFLKEKYLKIKELNKSIENFDNVFFKENLNYTNLEISCILELNSVITFQDIGNVNIVSILKKIWEKQMDISRKEILNMLNDEIKSIEDLDEKESVEEVKKMVEDFDYSDELNKISNYDEIFDYWPTLFLPAPDFLNKIRKVIAEQGLYCFMH